MDYETMPAGETRASFFYDLVCWQQGQDFCCFYYSLVAKMHFFERVVYSHFRLIQHQGRDFYCFYYSLVAKMHSVERVVCYPWLPSRLLVTHAGWCHCLGATLQRLTFRFRLIQYLLIRLPRSGGVQCLQHTSCSVLYVSLIFWNQTSCTTVAPTARNTRSAKTVRP